MQKLICRKKKYFKKSQTKQNAIQIDITHANVNTTNLVDECNTCVNTVRFFFLIYARILVCMGVYTVRHFSGLFVIFTFL